MGYEILMRPINIKAVFIIIFWSNLTIGLIKMPLHPWFLLVILYCESSTTLGEPQAELPGGYATSLRFYAHLWLRRNVKGSFSLIPHIPAPRAIPMNLSVCSLYSPLQHAILRGRKATGIAEGARIPDSDRSLHAQRSSSSCFQSVSRIAKPR
jgi:hypothetical protein